MRSGQNTNPMTTNPESLIYPVPAALVSCGSVSSPNLITIAWTGTVCSSPPMCYISVRKERYSHHLIMSMKQFVINLMPAGFVQEVDFCGTVSGRKVNKFEACGLTPAPCNRVLTVKIQEALVALECEVVQVLELGSHDMFLARVLETHITNDRDQKVGREPKSLANLPLLGYAKGWYIAAGATLLRYGANNLKDKLK